MNEIYVKKLGNSCTFFLDASNRSIPFTDVEQPPEHYDMIQTMSYQELIGAFPANTKFVFIEPPKRTEVSSPRLTPEQLRQHMGSLGVPTQDIDKMLAAPVGASKTTLEEPLNAPSGARPPFKPQSSSENEMNKILTEFRVLMAKYTANPQNPDVKKEVSAVANFILSCWPELEEQLVAIKESAAKPKFNL